MKSNLIEELRKFEESVDKQDISYPNCWTWIKGLSKKGYGIVKWNGKSELAHIVAYRLYVAAGNKALILRRCKNKACVNPDHLYTRNIIKRISKNPVASENIELPNNTESFESTRGRKAAEGLQLVNLCSEPDCKSLDHIVESSHTEESPLWIDCKDPGVLAKVNDYYKEKKYPYFRWNHALLRRSVEALNSENIELDGLNIVGSINAVGLLNAFHPQMEFVSVGKQITPFDTFINYQNQIIEECLDNNLSVTEAKLRQVIYNFDGCRKVSNFKPSCVRKILNIFKPKTFLDFSAGWGGRLLGALSLKIPYIGVDPSIFVYTGNSLFIKEFKATFPKHPVNVTLVKECAESFLEKREVISDFIFTSPPYFNLEDYSHESTQSHIKFPEKDLWYKLFLERVICGCHISLSNNGILVLNISEVMLSKTIDICLRNGFSLESIMFLRMSARKYNKSKSIFKTEPVLILRKR